MQAFMQSLQIRCPVAAQSGLSTVTMARAPRLLPRAFTKFISEIFSSSERLGVGGLVGEPICDMLGIAPLPGRDRQRLTGRRTDHAIDLASQARPVECLGVLLFDTLDRAALNKEALDRIERRELVVPRL